MTRKSTHPRGSAQRKKRPEPAKTDAPAKSGLEGERIAKVMARAGLCSRREAETWITEGRVSVNGAVIASPALNVTRSDKISVDGKPLPQAERTRLFLYHKPRGLVTTHADPEKRPTIFEKLPKDMPRVISVGRLDLNTEGLLLLTNDGGLARVLELPDTGWLRRYRVRANGKVTQPQLDALRKGVTVDGIRYGEIEATLDREQGANVWLTFAIREGKNREVRNVLEHLGLQVNRLIRVSFGPFQLGELAEGAVEEIRTRHLREQLGDRITTQANVDLAGPMTPLREDMPERKTPSPRAQTEAAPKRAPKGEPRREPSREPRREPRRDEGRRPQRSAPFKSRRDEKGRDEKSRDEKGRNAKGGVTRGRKKPGKTYGSYKGKRDR